MEGLKVSTTVARPLGPVFDLLVDFERYEAYSDYLEAVRAEGDGGPGTEYGLSFSWWKVRYDVRSRVTAVDRPREIAFRVMSGIAARGRWALEPLPADADTTVADTADEPAASNGGTRVSLIVAFDPDSVSDGAVSLPALVSIPWVIERVRPLLEREARTVVERVVADLEGESRRVELTVESATPGAAAPKRDSD